MGKAKKRYYRLHQKLRQENPDANTTDLYSKAIDIDQRRQAALQAERWGKQRDIHTHQQEDSIT